MKRNMSLLTDQVRSKLTGKCTTAVITEAFINALPFDKTELANESVNLSKYAARVIEKMHPDSILENAIESTINDSKANLYVSNLKNAINSVVEIATQRIVQESACTEETTPEIIANTRLNSDETEKIVAASKQSGTDAVAKLVKEKMINVIKDEKSAYEISTKIREEIKDVIKKERDDLRATLEEDDAIESYLNLVLEPTDARNHISVFSKMQDVCMEAIMHSTEEYSGEIPYATIEKITLESTFPMFDLSNKDLIEDLNSMLIVTESLKECSDAELAEKKGKVAKTAFICTICIMTLLETLKTMHLAKPELADIKNFVNDSTTIKNLTKVNLANVEDKVNAVINDSKKSVAMGSYNLVELSQAKESLEQAKGLIEKIDATGAEDVRKTRIINNINSALTTINTTKSSDDKSISGHFTNRLKEENLSSLEHGISLLSKKPIVREIRIYLRSDLKCGDKSKVDVELRGLDSSGGTVAIYNISIHALNEFGETVAEVIRDCANYCDLGAKPVSMYFTDSGYVVPVKG